MNISSYGSSAMDDELENFLRQRRARVAEDKARLEQDPPYMEVKVCSHGGLAIVKCLELGLWVN